MDSAWDVLAWGRRLAIGMLVRDPCFPLNISNCWLALTRWVRNPEGRDPLRGAQIDWVGSEPAKRSWADLGLGGLAAATAVPPPVEQRQTHFESLLAASAALSGLTGCR